MRTHLIANVGRDISKCAGTGCLKRESCERFTHPAREKFQAWIFMKVAIPDVDTCRFYMPIEAKEIE